MTVGIRFSIRGNSDAIETDTKWAVFIGTAETGEQPDQWALAGVFDKPEDATALIQNIASLMFSAADKANVKPSSGQLQSVDPQFDNILDVFKNGVN